MRVLTELSQFTRIWEGIVANRARWVPLLVILALAIVLRVGAAFYMGDRVEVLPGIHDQISYDALATNLLAGRGYEFDSDWYPFTPANTPTAHWSYAYPAYLALVYGLFGHHPLAARLIQLVIGSLLWLWLTYRLGKRFFGAPAGLAAAAAAAVYGYFVYHNAALMTETFYIVAVLAAFELAYSIVEDDQTTAWWLLGPTIGVAVLLRQVYLAFVPLLLLWIVWSKRSRRTILWLGITLAVVTLFILPWTLRNSRVYGRFLLLNSNSGYALYTSNHPSHGTEWDPWFTAEIPEDLHGANEAELDRELTRRGIEFIVADPVRYLRLSLSRLPYHLRFWPTSDARLMSNAVRFLSFGVFLPFMMAGLWLSRSQWPRFIPVYAFITVFIGLHVATWAGPRYRFPVDAVLLIFAGFALVGLYDFLLEKLGCWPMTRETSS